MKKEQEENQIKPGEIFRTITEPVFEQRYQISNYGRVWDCKRERFKKLTFDGRYFRLEIQINKVRIRRYIHRLVLREFLGPAPQGRNLVDHMNGDKTDNRLENLRYVDYYENSVSHWRRARKKNYPSDEDLQDGEVWDYVEGIHPDVNRKYLVTSLGRVWSLSQAKFLSLQDRGTKRYAVFYQIDTKIHAAIWSDVSELVRNTFKQNIFGLIGSKIV